MRSPTLKSLTICTCLALVGLSPAPSAARDVILAEPAHTVSLLPVYLAVQKGYFKDEEIDLTIQTMSNNAFVTAVLTGQAFAFLGSVDHNAFAKVNGKTLKAVSNVVGRPNTYIMVRSDLMPVTGELSQFLKGKRIAVAPYGRTPNNMLRYILSRMHLDPKNDVTLVEVETNVVPTTVGAKQADAGASQEPFISIGYKRGVWGQPVYSAASDLGPYTDTALSVRPESIEKEPALVRSMVRAMVRGLVYANAHRDEMVALARSEYPNASADDLDASLKRAFADDIFSADGFIPLEAWTTGEAVVRQGGILKEHVAYEDVIDMRFVNEIRTEMNIK